MRSSRLLLGRSPIWDHIRKKFFPKNSNLAAPGRSTCESGGNSGLSALNPPTLLRFRTGPILPCRGGGKGVGVRGGRGDDAAWLKRGGVGGGGKKGAGEGEGVAKAEGRQRIAIIAKWGKDTTARGPHYK